VITAFTQVPRFGDELDLADDRILFDQIEEGGQPVHLVKLPGQAGSQIGSESIDVHLGNPITEGIDDELKAARVADIEAIARTCGVVVEEGFVLNQAVIGSIVYSLEG
jgi:hypothetical protein